MAEHQNGDTRGQPAGSGDADLAQAFKDITRGEQTATALEAHLTDLERKIEELLARADEDERNRLNRPDESSHQDPPAGSDSGSV